MLLLHITISLLLRNIIENKEIKGPKVIMEEKEKKGEDKQCDITSHKIKRFKLKVPDPEKYKVDQCFRKCYS